MQNIFCLPIYKLLHINFILFSTFFAYELHNLLSKVISKLKCKIFIINTVTNPTLEYSNEKL